MCLFFGGKACGIQLPDQGSNSHPLHWKVILNHWTAREVPILQFKKRDLLAEGGNR